MTSSLPDSTAGPSRAARIRAQLNHPVIDADGHLCEHLPTFVDYLKDTAGSTLADEFLATRRDDAWSALSPEERRRRRVWRPSWWSYPARNHPRPRHRHDAGPHARTYGRLRDRLHDRLHEYRHQSGPYRPRRATTGGVPGLESHVARPVPGPGGPHHPSCRHTLVHSARGNRGAGITLSKSSV